MKYLLLSILTFIVLLQCYPQISLITSPDITQEEIKQHIRYLASDSLEGRRSGEKGDSLAAMYIAERFKKFGLKPAGDGNSYFQKFSFISKRIPGPDNKLNIFINGITLDFKLHTDYKPLSFSIDTTLNTSIVFAGYGISAPESLKYDDYKNINVSGKIVAVLRYSPDTTGILSQYSSVMAKTFTARDKGAAGIIFLTNPRGTEGDNISSFDDPRMGNSGISVLAMQWEAFSNLMKKIGYNLDSIRNKINSSLTPNSMDFAGVNVSLQTQILKISAGTSNVVGFLEGNDPVLKNEVLIIGAHFDHLGMGGEGSGSLRPDTLAPHHGADDNASGTAGVLELAQYFSSIRDSLKRSILFIAFSGEELGVLGSSYYVNNPIYPLDKTILMINMDMIGRMKDSILVIEGMGTSPLFEEIVKILNYDSLTLRLKPDGIGPSDQVSFYQKDIPVMFFFTNLHSDYHKPSDTWDKINYSGEQKILKLVSRIATRLLNGDQRPQFTKVASTLPPPSTTRQGNRVSLGIIPDFAGDTPGMKISGARPDSPAERAGLKADDVIIKFAGKEIKNIYDFTYVLGQCQPGQEVEIVVKRGTEEITLKTILEGKKSD